MPISTDGKYWSLRGCKEPRARRGGTTCHTGRPAGCCRARHHHGAGHDRGAWLFHVVSQGREEKWDQGGENLIQPLTQSSSGNWGGFTAAASLGEITPEQGLSPEACWAQDSERCTPSTDGGGSGAPAAGIPDRKGQRGLCSHDTPCPCTCRETGAPENLDKKILRRRRGPARRELQRKDKFEKKKS